jgi:hypothetical protein
MTWLLLAWSFLLFGGFFNRMADLTEEHSLNRLLLKPEKKEKQIWKLLSRSQDQN